MIVRKGPLFLLGDVNFDVGCSSKPGVVSYLRMLSDLNLHQLIDKPIRLGTSGPGTVIDHVIADTAGLGQYASVIPVHVSDHDLVMLDAPLPRDRRPPRDVTVRSLRDVNYDRLRLDLFLANWEPVYRAACADTKYDAFLTVWNGYIDQHCPFKTVSFRHQGCPWLTSSDSLRELQAQRDAARRQRDRLHDQDSEREYNRLHAKFKHQLALARRDFFTAPSRFGNTKEMWNNLRKFALGPGAVDSQSDSEIRPNDFNAFFSRVGSRVADELNATPCEPMGPRPPIVCSSAFRVHVVTLPELSAALRQMSGSRTADSDGIRVQLLRECFEVVGPIVLHIVNHSLSTGVVPCTYVETCHGGSNL